MAFKIGVGLFTGQIPASSDRTFHREYQDYLELVRGVEEVGLDSAWVSEHHFAEDGYLPSLTVMLAAFAAVTERIELGTGVILAPFHDPIRIAEDFAVVDQLSGGRTISGFGIGWRDEEFRGLQPRGVGAHPPDERDRRDHAARMDHRPVQLRGQVLQLHRCGRYTEARGVPRS